MSFSKEQSLVLNQLSLMLYGSTSKWKKMYDSGKFDTLKETEEEIKVEYIAVPSPKRRGAYTQMKVDTAKRLGVVSKDYEAPTRKNVTKVKPSYEDIRNALVTTLPSTALGYMSANQRNTYFADELLNGTLKFRLRFQQLPDESTQEQKDAYKENLEKLLSDQVFSDEQKEKLKSLMDSADKNSLEVDGVDFLLSAKTLLLEPEQTRAELKEVFENCYRTLYKQNSYHGSVMSAAMQKIQSEKTRRRKNELKRHNQKKPSNAAEAANANSLNASSEAGPVSASVGAEESQAGSSV